MTMPESEYIQQERMEDIDHAEEWHRKAEQQLAQPVSIDAMHEVMTALADYAYDSKWSKGTHRAVFSEIMKVWIESKQAIRLTRLGKMATRIFDAVRSEYGD